MSALQKFQKIDLLCKMCYNYKKAKSLKIKRRKIMKRCLFWLLMLASAIAGVIWGYMALRPDYSVVEDYINKEVTISYQSVNVRKDPDGEIIGELQYNDKVILTGKICELNEVKVAGSYKWVEIYYDEATAWITPKAIE